jgi:hypothetical protein
MKKIIQSFQTFLLLMSLAACGGGGSASEGTTTLVPSVATFSIDAAYKKNITTSKNLTWSLSGIVNGLAVSGSGTLNETYVSGTTFNGLVAQLRTSAFNGTLSGQGQSAPYTQTERTYYDSLIRFIGSSGSAGVTYANTILGTLPTAAKIGDQGNLSTTTSYSNAAKTTVLGSSNVGWVLSADSATSALLKLTSSGNGVTTVETLRLTTTGEVTRVSIESNVNGQVLKFSF